MPLTKLFELFRSGLLAQHRHGGVAGNEFDQNGDEGDDGPDNEQQDGDPPERSKNLMLRK